MSELETPVGNRTAADTHAATPHEPDARCAECDEVWPCATELLERTRAERDAAVARVAELEAAIEAHRESTLGTIRAFDLGSPSGEHTLLWSLLASTGAPEAPGADLRCTVCGLVLHETTAEHMCPSPVRDLRGETP